MEGQPRKQLKMKDSASSGSHVMVGWIMKITLLFVGIAFMFVVLHNSVSPFGFMPISYFFSSFSSKELSEPQLEPKLEPQFEPKLEPKSEPKLESQLEPKSEPKLESQLEPKLEPKQEPKLEPKLESKLEAILRNAAMDDKTVLLTSLNDAWAEPGSLFDVFLESFRIGNQTERLLKHMVVITLDQKAYARCLALHPHCYHLETKGENFTSEAGFMSPRYLRMMWGRNEFQGQILELGYNFIFTDADIVWLRDPFQFFYEEADFQIASDVFNGNSYDMKNLPNGGFTYVKSNNRTIEFYKFWNSSRISYPGMNEQEVLNKIKTHPFVSEIKLRLRFLDTAYFNGFCQKRRDLNKVCTVHANCCFGLGNKVDDLKLLLDDWRKYMSLPPEEKQNSLPSSNVPKNCRGSFKRALNKKKGLGEPKLKPKLESKLETVLRNAATEDKTVLLTSLNDAWAEPGSLFDVFLESFRIGNQTDRLLKHMVVITLDQKAYARCLALHPHCYHLETKGENFTSEAGFMSPRYLRMMWGRNEFQGQILELGYNFVFTDADIVWLRDPFQFFYKEADFQIASDVFFGNSYDMKNLPNGGFTYVKSNNRTIEFYKFWNSSRISYPGMNEQEVLNKIKKHPFVSEIKLRLRFLDTAYFNGFCQKKRDLNKVCTVHANCCLGLGNKVDDLKLLLDDWRKYMSLPPEEKQNSLPSSNVPKNCRGSFKRALNKKKGLGEPKLKPHLEPKLKPKLESKLEAILRNAAMEDKTVLLTSLNDAWVEPGSLFDVFLESFRIGNQTERLLKHLVVITLDQKAYARCLALHPYCYHLETKGENFTSEAGFMSPRYLRMMWGRNEFQGQILELGYNFVFTDTDIMWLRDPFQIFYKEADFQIASDVFFGNSYDMKNLPNGGFTYVKSNNRTIEFYKFWNSSRISYPGMNEQEVLNKIKTHPFVSKIKLSLRFLDTTYFNGFCQRSRDLNKVYTVHANCCLGLENKVDDLKLLLDDWRKYMSLPPEEKQNSLPSSSVPKSCRN
ncbi:Glycosyltransferase [Quillaja saponaria]|uniref:Glycosyltransferase n=1 Tax=Quillaja saponaria TaxID=32244 RepID=A0AAD7PW98_QUISA|nr:Glycosyltransferase [Quillaja saponaria]